MPLSQKPQQIKKAEVLNTQNYDIHKLAKAVAMAETNNCTRGIGKKYNNCFGIKNGNTAPCSKIGINKFCIYEDPKESYEAFKKIWKTHYGKMPNLQLATRWTGNDSPYTWLNNINKHYYDIN